MFTTWLGGRKEKISYEVSGEGMYSPSIYLTATDGYAFFGLSNTNGNPPQILADPALRFPPVAVTSLLMGRFKDGPLGDLDYVRYF